MIGAGGCYRQHNNKHIRAAEQSTTNSRHLIRFLPSAVFVLACDLLPLVQAGMVQSHPPISYSAHKESERLKREVVGRKL